MWQKSIREAWSGDGALAVARELWRTIPFSVRRRGGVATPASRPTLQLQIANKTFRVFCGCRIMPSPLQIANSILAITASQNQSAHQAQKQKKIHRMEQGIDDMHGSHQRESEQLAHREIDHVHDVRNWHPYAAVAEVGESLHYAVKSKPRCHERIAKRVCRIVYADVGKRR